ncbi:hypothetical protein NDI45_25110 [Leptolyngbya sp. GB1-A1]|uniref:Calx-beta domain-containing protein n=1 Tax=Leptolyngbya sp. GB1-A1 TaxID=2933908 RepID=UPI003298A207
MADYNETFLGDLSDDISNPTAHEFYPGKLVLFPGSNVVTGSTTKRTTPANGGDEDRDFFVFDVPSGFTVDAIYLRSYQQTGGGNSYFALIEGNAFPANSIDNAQFPELAKEFKVSKLIDTDEVGGEQDLLDYKASAQFPSELGPNANPGQLDAGTYTAWYQETANPTTYSFDIRLKAPEGANFGQIQFDPSSFSVDEDAGTFNITLTRTGGTDGNVGVELRRFGGTATNLDDFSFHPATAIFEQGETEKTFTYSLLDDDLVEGDETAIFELVNPMGGVAIGSNNQATLTILDNDSPDVFRFEAEDLTLDTYLIEANEFASGGQLVSFRQASGRNGSVSTTFEGASDTYNVIVRYLDETDGTSTLDFKVNGGSVESWTLDKNLDSSGPSERAFTERLIRGVALQSGDLIAIESAKDRNEEARIDSIQVVPADRFYKFEAEDMLLGNYLIENNEFASGDRLISLRNAAGDTGTATTEFTGPTGVYDITVGYLDESDGEGELDLWVDGASTGRWSLDKDLGNNNPLEQTFVEREIRGVSLNNGSTMTIMGEQDSFEWARVDFLRIIPATTRI